MIIIVFCDVEFTITSAQNNVTQMITEILGESHLPSNKL